MFNILCNLIKKHYYNTKEEVLTKIEVCFAMNRITQDEYSSLVMLVDEYYNEAE